MIADVSRREFLKRSALAAGGGALWRSRRMRAAGGLTVALVLSPDDPLAAAPHVEWAVRELRQALENWGAAAVRVETIAAAPASALTVIVAGCDNPSRRRFWSGHTSGFPARRSHWRSCPARARGGP